MLISQQQRWYRARSAGFVALLSIVLACLAPSRAIAQESNEQSSFLKDVAKRLVLDPTTYAPAIISYDGTLRDWNSSQPLFAAGFMEQNSRFTVTGRPNDVAVGYDAGRQRILMDSLAILQMSLVNNAVTGVLERALVDRYPERRKLVRALGWVERISLGAYMSYRLSSQHYRQAGVNEQMARQYGLR